MQISVSSDFFSFCLRDLRARFIFAEEYPVSLQGGAHHGQEDQNGQNGAKKRIYKKPCPFFPLCCLNVGRFVDLSNLKTMSPAVTSGCLSFERQFFTSTFATKNAL